jgi:hypothetical protein
MLTKILKPILLLAALVYASNSISCDYPTKVKAQDTVACDGVILTDKQFIDASNNKKEIRLKDLKIAKLEGTVELMELRHSVYKKELGKTRDQLSDLEIKSTFGYVISFSLGAVITGYIAKEVLK